MAHQSVLINPEAKLKSITFSLIFAVATAASADTLWRQYGFNAAHTSYNNHETILNVSNVSRLTLFWKSPSFNNTDSGRTAPTLGFSAIFFPADGRVHAIESQTGAPRWGRLSCSGERTVQPAFGRGVLLVGDGGGDLAAYDPGTGAQIWCDDESGSIISAPAIADDTVFITNGVDTIAIDQFTGRQHWRFTSGDFVPLNTTPAIAKGRVFVTGGNSVFALDGITGKRIWRHDLGPQANISSPAVANDIVYVGGTALYALDAIDGHLVWKSNKVGVNVTTPAVAEGRVFVNSEDPEFGLHAFDANTGALLWENGGDESEATVTVANGVVYEIDEEGELMLLNARNGTILGTITDPDGRPFLNNFGSQPIVANGVVYVSTGDRVDAFHLAP